MTTAAPHILVVDDDHEIRTLLGRYLAEQQFRVSLAEDHRGLQRVLAADRVDLIVLDVMLPDGSGLDICRELRGRDPSILIILLTALKEEVDRIIGLEFGADDYLGKPFNPRELTARIRAVLRRRQSNEIASEDRVYRFDRFSVDVGGRRVVHEEGGEIELTSAEFDLFLAMVARPGRVLSRDQLMTLTHGRNSDPFDRSIDVLMSRIRRKLRPYGGEDMIKTVRNGGYQFAMRVDVTGASA